MAENPTVLTFISTKDLLDELYKRHDAVVVAGIKFTKVRGDYEVTRYFRGHRVVCLGVIENVKSLINDEENRNLQGVSDAD